MDMESEARSELTVHLATDAGLLAIVAPGELALTLDDAWWTDEDSLVAAANAGRVVPIETGEGGGYAVRITFEGLNERERRVAAQSAEFWLRVPEDEEVAVVTGEELSFPDTPGAATFWAASGSYNVQVTRLRWTEESDDEADDDALPDYVVRLRPFHGDEDPPEIHYLPDLSIGGDI